MCFKNIYKAQHLSLPHFVKCSGTVCCECCQCCVCPETGVFNLSDSAGHINNFNDACGPQSYTLRTCTHNCEKWPERQSDHKPLCNVQTTSGARVCSYFFKTAGGPRQRAPRATRWRPLLWDIALLQNPVSPCFVPQNNPSLLILVSGIHQKSHWFLSKENHAWLLGVTGSYKIHGQFLILFVPNFSRNSTAQIISIKISTYSFRSKNFIRDILHFTTYHVQVRRMMILYSNTTISFM
jgi:hypothetical protein